VQQAGITHLSWLQGGHAATSHAFEEEEERCYRADTRYEEERRKVLQGGHAATLQQTLGKMDYSQNEEEGCYKGHASNYVATNPSQGGTQPARKGADCTNSILRKACHAHSVCLQIAKEKLWYTASPEWALSALLLGPVGLR
jgi:hypothetical protein